MGPPWVPPKISHGLPVRPPSNSRNLIDYPPSKSCRKTPSTTPPARIHGTSSTTPPQNRARKLHQLPPLEFIDYPPLEIMPENSINYPPSNSRKLIDYPPSKSGRKTPCSFSHGFRFSKLDKYGKVLIHY